MLNITELTCRVCLEENNVLINIYDELEELHTNLSNLLQTCADLQINRNDKYPKYLCEDCTRELLITCKFREKCHKSKEILHKLLDNIDTVQKEDLSNINDIIEYCTDEVNDIEADDWIIEEAQYTENETQCIELIDEIAETEKQDSGLSLLRKNCGEVLSTTMSESLVLDTTAKENNINKDIQEPVEEEIKPASRDNATLVVPLETTNILTKPVSGKLKRTHIYKCDICGAIFKQAINLQKHLQKSHDRANCFVCCKCEHWFSIETEFYTHFKNCNYNEKSFENKIIDTIPPTLEPENNRKCLYCERDFPTPFALRMHLRIHTGERPFQCKYCTKSFKTQSQLNIHHKRHTGQADFICTICNKTFYEQSNLTVHIRSHTGERPHVCTVCNKTFTRVSLLQFHMRIHTGEKPFKCNYCNKNFRQHTDLRSHLTIHTGQKQHACIVCGKLYIKRSHLLNHMRKHPIQIGNAETTETGEIENEDSNDELRTATDNIQNYA